MSRLILGLAAWLLGGCAVAVAPVQERVAINVRIRHDVPPDPPPSPVELAARTRAYNDLTCSQADIAFHEIESDHEKARADVIACGSHVRYRCLRAWGEQSTRVGPVPFERESRCEPSPTTE